MRKGHHWSRQQSGAALLITAILYFNPTPYEQNNEKNEHSMSGRSIRKPKGNKKGAKARPKRWKPVPDSQLKNLEETIKTGLNLPHTPRDFQCRAIKAQLQQRDVLVHAATGSGKTTIVAGPHAHPVVKGTVTLLVSPLIALQDEQVSKPRQSERGVGLPNGRRRRSGRSSGCQQSPLTARMEVCQTRIWRSVFASTFLRNLEAHTGVHLGYPYRPIPDRHTLPRAYEDERIHHKSHPASRHASQGSLSGH